MSMIYEQLEMSGVLPQMKRTNILQQKLASWLLHVLVPQPGKPFPLGELMP